MNGFGDVAPLCFFLARQSSQAVSLQSPVNLLPGWNWAVNSAPSLQGCSTQLSTGSDRSLWVPLEPSSCTQRVLQG